MSMKLVLSCCSATVADAPVPPAAAVELKAVAVPPEQDRLIAAYRPAVQHRIYCYGY